MSLLPLLRLRLVHPLRLALWLAALIPVSIWPTSSSSVSITPVPSASIFPCLRSLYLRPVVIPIPGRLITPPLLAISSLISVLAVPFPIAVSPEIIKASSVPSYLSTRVFVSTLVTVTIPARRSLRVIEGRFRRLSGTPALIIVTS